MKMDGGTTGGMALSTRQAIKTDLEKLFTTYQSNPRLMAVKFIKGVEIWNTVFEDSTRLSVYKNALENGMSRPRAAALAKDATIDFDKRGSLSPSITAWYMFANVSVQGSAKMIRSMKNPKVAAATFSVVMAAVLTCALHNDDEDEDWRDGVTKWDLANNLIWVTSSDESGIHYIKIPVSWGLKPIKVLCDYSSNAVLGRYDKPTEIISGMFAAIIEGYNPLGGNDIWQAVFPTPADTAVDLLRNRSWSGGKIRPDWLSGLPGSKQVFDTTDDTITGKAAIQVSKGLQAVNWHVSPENIIYAYEQLIGGAGRFVTKVGNTAVGLVEGDAKLDNAPFISRFYAERSEDEIKGTVKKLGKNKLFYDVQNSDSDSETVGYILGYLEGKTLDEKKAILLQLRELGIDTRGISAAKSPETRQDVTSILKYRSTK